MQTSTLWTPGIWSKNLTWIVKPDDEFSAREVDVYHALSHTPGVLSYLGQHLHRKTGKQFQVQQEVSRDMMLSDFSPGTRLETVAWPAPSVEMYFEDPAIPTALIQWHQASQLESIFPVICTDPRPRVVAMMELSNSQMCVLNLRQEHWDQLLTTGECPNQRDCDAPLSSEENAALKEMVKLAFKVFAYASIERYAPEPLTRGYMRFGGKPGVRNRPNRPSLRVVYLPQTVVATPVPSEGTSSTGHQFFGRRGHFRYYHSERFVNKKGTWTYIAPIPARDTPPAGHTAKTVYKVVAT